jgi:hypothetical protein
VTRWLAVASVAVLAVVGAVVFALTYDSPSHSASPQTVPLVSSARHQFDALGGLVGASDLVVVGRVIADEDGRLFGDPNAGDSHRAPSAIRSHVLTLRVERVLAGADPAVAVDADTDTVLLVEEEYALVDGTPVRVDGMRRGRIGDRGVWFLTASGDPEFPAYALVNAQGRYLFRGNGLQGGDRSDAFVRAVERLDRTQLQDAVVAATSISR